MHGLLRHIFQPNFSGITFHSPRLAPLGKPLVDLSLCRRCRRLPPVLGYQRKAAEQPGGYSRWRGCGRLRSSAAQGGCRRGHREYRYYSLLKIVLVVVVVVGTQGSAELTDRSRFVQLDFKGVLRPPKSTFLRRVPSLLLIIYVASPSGRLFY